MDKIKTISFDNNVFEITTSFISTASKKKTFQGQPTVALYDSFVQIGCMRVTKIALKELLRQIEQQPDNGKVTVQIGNYSTKDPNTR